MFTLKAGTILYHGTDCDDFEEEFDNLEGPAWLSSSKAVALHFAVNRSNGGGVKRIISYVLDEDVQLPDLYSRAEMYDFAEEHGLELDGTEEIRDSVDRAGIPGWIIPNNYPDGDDILLASTHCLTYEKTETI